MARLDPVVRLQLHRFSLRWARGAGAAFVLVACSFISTGVARAQISPGPLSRAHQSLNGPTQCTSCHVVGQGSAVLNCTGCHAEIASELSSGHGLHATFPDKQACAQCHSEHNGEDFQLIHWVPSQKGFDHSQTGYMLQGKHAQIDCTQCHTPAHISTSVKPLIKMKDLQKTLLGLSPVCTTCHQDPHKGQLGANCTQCHNFVDWNAAKGFDHNKTRFPLTGLHANVSCEKCHTPAAPGGQPRFSGIAFAKCSDCHADPHQGAFGDQTCETCHTTSGWKTISAERKFDHSKTKYPLLGMHARVDCLQCHTGGNFHKALAFANCTDCHRDDPHSGQFAQRADKGECSSCHTVQGWKPSLFDLKAHASTSYPLLGKHAALSCDKCHTPAGKATRYKIAFSQCTDCHRDEHGGQFAAAPYNEQCEGCHTVKGFSPSTFTIALHAKSQFPLEGAHMAISCNECHTAGMDGQADKIVPYHFTDLSCTGCHKNPHGQEFEAKMTEKVADGRPKGCQACHTVKSWTDLPSFDHSKTNFPLIGAHENVQCEQCHKPSGPSGQLAEVSFKSAPTACSSCHEDPHGSQFALDGNSQNCDTCHNSVAWKPSLFNHETQTDFSLKGAHEHVPCNQCHTATSNVNGKRVIMYKLAPRACADCHS